MRWISRAALSRCEQSSGLLIGNVRVRGHYIDRYCGNQPVHGL